MRLHWIGPATFLVEAAGCSVLVDPRFGESGPHRDLDLAASRRGRRAELPDFDVLVITSRRGGRFDVPTLAALPRDVEVLLPTDPALAQCLSQLGYARVSQCRPFDELSVGATRLLITPAASGGECGVLIADAAAVLWSIADLVIEGAVVDEVLARSRSVDVMVAAWRPRAVSRSLRSPEPPSARYREHLATVQRARPRSLVPWGAAESHRPAPSTSRLEVPVSRERFLLDASGGSFAGEAFSLDPGDVLTIERDAVIDGTSGAEVQPSFRLSSGACPFVTRLDEETTLRPAPLSPPSGEDLGRLSDFITREVEEGLLATFSQEIGSTYAEHRSWGVVYRLEVLLGVERLTWSFDFTASDDGSAVVGLQRGANPLANFLTTIRAEELGALAQGHRECDAVVTGGGYHSSEACYRIADGGLERPAALQDPLVLRYGGDRFFVAVTERAIETERARWAARLLGSLASSATHDQSPDAALVGAGEPAVGDGRSRSVAPTIPLFITEEHHEAFLAWHVAMRQGLMPSSGNLLLHVDQHSDMKPPRYHRPLPALDADLGEIESFTYEEMDIESFLAAACHQGLYDRIEWLQRDEPPAMRRFCVTSLGDERKALAIEEQTADGEPPPPDRSWLTWSRRKLDGPAPDPPAPGGATVLGIDLDYFSCDDALNRRASLEVTPAELAAFRSNPYHPLRLGSRFQARVDDGRCFLDYNRFDDGLASPRRASDEQIAERVASLIEFLARHRICPQLITITRSRYSGFTPAHQWQRIEELLLGGLHSLYDLRLISIDEVRRPAEAPATRQRPTAEAPRMASATLPVARGASFPSFLDFPGGRVLLIPTGCNNRCSFCMVDEFIETNDHRGRPRGEAPLSAELRALIDELPPGHRVDFFGAEPTLHDSFFNLLQAAASRRLRITLATNGRVFSSAAYTRRVAGLAAPDLLQVRTSILGATAEVHDAISGAPGSFDQMLKGARNLVEHGYQVHFNLVLTRENAHQAEDVARVGIDHGAASMKISGLIDLHRNAASFVPYGEVRAPVEAFCSVCERGGVPYSIEKLPLCAAPRRMHRFVYEQGVYTPDRGILAGPGQPCRSCVVRNVCFGVEPAFVERFGSDGLMTVRSLPEEVQTPLPEILERRAQPPFYRVAFTRVVDGDLDLDAWADLLRFKQSCEGEVGDLCIERVGSLVGAGLDVVAH